MASRLPEGYTEREYILSAYETFLRLNQTYGKAGTTDVYIDCETTANSCFYGSSDTSSAAEGYYEGAYNNSSSTIYCFSDDWAGQISGWSHNARHTFEWSYTKRAAYIDGILKASPDDWYGGDNLYVLYGKPWGDKTYFYGKVYEVRVANVTFIPATRDSDGAVGFYASDGSFWESGGDAPFTAGPEVKPASTIFKGDTLISAIFLGEKELKGVFYQEHQLYGGGGITPTPKIEYDYTLDGDFDEVDILFTADTHLAWKGYNKYSGQPQKYVPQDIAAVKDDLWESGIPTFAVDCGDFDHGQNAPISTIINHFNNFGSIGYRKYLSVTFGNHEWYSAMGNAEQCMSYLRQVTNMSACNLLVNGEPVFKPYRAIKIGEKKIGIIAVGYPSPNGRQGSPENSDVHNWSGYTFYDARRDQTATNQPNSALYKQVQKYIDMFKKRHFDFILVNCHMDMNQYESVAADERFNARAEYLIQNTNGLDVVIPGHYNIAIPYTYEFRHYDGVGKGIVSQEAGAGLGSYGRIRLNLRDGSIISTLVQ